MKRFLITTCMFASLMSSYAQDASATEETPHTLKNEFNEMLNSSNNYQDFKVVKRRSLDAFIDEVSDTLKVADERLMREIKAKESYQQQVDKLQSDLEQSQGLITEAEANRDNITSVGMTMEKASFSQMMWGIVIALGAALVFLIFRNKNVSATHKDLRHRLNEVEEDLNLTKKKSLEREQELKREIQDHVNKLDSMTPPR